MLSAIDQDGDQVTFLGDNDAFEIVKNEEGAWEVVVKDPSKIDYEAGSEITLTVTASGGAGPSSQGTSPSASPTSTKPRPVSCSRTS